MFPRPVSGECKCAQTDEKRYKQEMVYRAWHYLSRNIFHRRYDCLEDYIQKAYTKDSRKHMKTECGEFYEMCEAVCKMGKEKFCEEILKEFDERKVHDDREYKCSMFRALDAMPKSVINGWLEMNKEVE